MRHAAAQLCILVILTAGLAAPSRAGPFEAGAMALELGDDGLQLAQKRLNIRFAILSSQAYT